MSEESNQNGNDETSTHKTEKQKFKNAICYVPFVAPVLFFVEQDKTPDFTKHMKYGIFLLIGIIVGKFLSDLVPFFNIYGILILIYFVASGYLGYKAYLGEDFSIKTIDDIEKKVKDNMK